MKDVEGLLSDQLSRREKLLRESRDVISSCSRAIIDVHGGNLPEALRQLAGAKEGLTSLRKLGDGPLIRYLVPPETEFVEASTVIALAKGRPIPSRKSLGASPEAYLLGLLDTVGELKRLTLDSIMKGKMQAAEKHFQSMERLYSACSPLTVYDHVANGARRKVDVARMLVEDVRGLLAEEIRREAVSEKMRRLERRLAGSR